MITPEEIFAKAERLYMQVLRSWLNGDSDFFPRTIPSSKSLEFEDVAAAIEAVQQLRNGSKATLGYGYTVQWELRRSRKLGQNAFPKRILFETREDLLRLIGRQREFKQFSSAVTRLRTEFSERLESWFPSNTKLLIENAADIDGLIAVVKYFQKNPRPNRFARELPIPVDTKFIERHQNILRQWLDRILPPHAIRSDETQFERRYGLRDKEPFLILRCLDPAIQAELGLISAEIALPLQTLAMLPVQSAIVFVIENRTTLRTFPDCPRGIAIEGLGRAVTELRDIAWLATNELHYWGDLDVEGFQILSSFRKIFPEVSSLLMDLPTLESYRESCTPGNRGDQPTPENLTVAEQPAYDRCSRENTRLEQERIPQEAVIRWMIE